MAGGDKTISISPPGTIGFVRSDAAVLLRFDETTVTDRPADAIGTLGDLVPGTVATAGVLMTMPAMVDGVTGRARQFTGPSGVALSGLVGNDIVSGTSLFTRDLTIQAILSLDVAAQASSSGTGTVIRRGAAYSLNLHVVSAPIRLCSMGVAVQFTMPAGFTLLTWTRRWESPTRTVSRYYVGDLLVGEEAGALSIGGATIDPVFVGFGQAGGFDPFVGAIDELIVYGRELTAEEIENTWLRITRYQPLGVALFRETHDEGFPQSLDPASDVQLENRMVGNALGFAAATMENIRANALPGRSYGTTLTDWETAVRVTPAPAASIDERRSRVVARLRQRRGVSIGGLEDALVGLLGGATNEDLEFLAFTNTITDDFTTLNLSRWDVTPVGAFAAVSGKAHVAPGAGEFLVTSGNWRTCAAAVGGDSRAAHLIAKVALTTPQAQAEVGIHFGDVTTGNWLLIGLRDNAGSFQVVTERFISGVSAGLTVRATLGGNPAAIWFHMFQIDNTGIWTLQWSTTGPLSGYTSASPDMVHATMNTRAGLYFRSSGTASPIPAAVADFDDVILRSPFGTRPFNAYVLLDSGLGFDPDVDGATSVIQAIKHAYTHACFITSRDLLCDTPFGCDCGPMGGI